MTPTREDAFTPAMILVLTELAADKRTAATVADELGMHESTVTHALRRLAAVGLVDCCGGWPRRWVATKRGGLNAQELRA
jgi:predicted transcriptional regulator